MADVTPGREDWPLADGVVYLNHGSFGPSPRAVCDARAEWQRQQEADPVDFLQRRLGPLLDEARAKLAAFVGADAEDLVFVENATAGMNAVAASFPLEADDEVLCCDHEYGAVLRIWEGTCGRAGARLVVPRLPLPLASHEEIIDAIFAETTERTRLLVVSHVSSPTAVVFPAAALCREAQRRGLAVCVDGPHALAMYPLEISSLDCDYYTASCHKWLCAPFGAGLLYVHPRRQAEIRPAVVSWGRPQRTEVPTWRDEFNWPGTKDFSAPLAIPAAIDFLRSAGLERFRTQTHELVDYARARITELTGLEPITPPGRAWYGSMAAMPLPPGDAPPLQQALWQRHRIEVPIVAFHDRRLIRVSCHLYNNREEIDLLTDALREALGEVA